MEQKKKKGGSAAGVYFVFLLEVDTEVIRLNCIMSEVPEMNECPRGRWRRESIGLYKDK